MKEENKFVVGCLLIIAIMSLALVGFVIYKDGPPDAIQSLILLVSSVASGLIGYLTKSFLSAPKEDKPTPVNNDSGKAKLIPMVALLWLCIAGLCLSIGLSGCIKPVMKQDVAERIAVSISAKALGQHMQGHFDWSPQIDSFAMMIERDGITLQSGQILTNYLAPRVPPLYARETSILLDSIGFEFSGSQLLSVEKVDKSLLVEAIGAFKEGLFYKSRD